MGGFAKDMIRKNMLALRDYVWKEHGHPVLCNACYFEADDEDKKIYGKPRRKNYKTSTMTINLITKKNVNFLILIKHPALTLQNQGYEK
jgi:hypothetical protein